MIRVFISFLLLAGCVAAQSIPPDRLTFSASWSRQLGGYSYEEKETSTGLGLSYGYRFQKYVEAESGVFTALQPAPSFGGANYFVNPDDRFIWVPFGVRFIAPLYLGRIEFSGGGGGLYEKYSVSNPDSTFGLESRSGWGGYFTAAAAVALDRRRHFWAGAAARWYLANPPYARDRWIEIGADMSYRF